MAVNNNFLLVYDLETDGVDPKICNIWSMSFLPVHPRTLEIMHDEEFKTYVRPTDITDWSEYEVSTQGARNVNHIEIDKIKDAPTTQQVFGSLSNFVRGYGGKGKNAPVRCGFNILGYDNPILDRFSALYGYVTPKEKKQNLFNNVFSIDLIHMLFGYFENYECEVENYKLDTFRDYFGLSKEGAHTASKDVADTASILVRFLKLQRSMLAGLECPCGKVRKVTLKNAFKK